MQVTCILLPVKLRNMLIIFQFQSLLPFVQHVFSMKNVYMKGKKHTLIYMNILTHAKLHFSNIYFVQNSKNFRQHSCISQKSWQL